MKTHVIASNILVFKEWCRIVGADPNSVKFVSDVTQICGFRPHNSCVVKISPDNEIDESIIRYYRNNW